MKTWTETLNPEDYVKAAVLKNPAKFDLSHGYTDSSIPQKTRDRLNFLRDYYFFQFEERNGCRYEPHYIKTIDKTKSEWSQIKKSFYAEPKAGEIYIAENGGLTTNHTYAQMYLDFRTVLRVNGITISFETPFLLSIEPSEILLSRKFGIIENDTYPELKVYLEGNPALTKLSNMGIKTHIDACNDSNAANRSTSGLRGISDLALIEAIVDEIYESPEVSVEYEKRLIELQLHCQTNISAGPADELVSQQAQPPRIKRKMKI